MMQKQKTNFAMHIETIKNILEHIDVMDNNKQKINILDQSGSVFFSGYGTLLNPNGVYLLAINPAGDPETNNKTISKSLDEFQEKIDEDFREEKINSQYNNAYFHAYLDEDWEDKDFQKNAVDAFEKLHLCLRQTCTSNSIFQRTKKETDIYGIKTTRNAYIHCHDYIINTMINPSVIIAVGETPWLALKDNWEDEKGKDVPLNTNNGKAVKGSPWYIESKDGDKILCYLPHFSWSSWYEKFLTCNIEELRDKIHEKLKKRDILNLPKWKFKNSWQSLFSKN